MQQVMQLNLAQSATGYAAKPIAECNRLCRLNLEQSATDYAPKPRAEDKRLSGNRRADINRLSP